MVMNWCFCWGLGGLSPHLHRNLLHVRTWNRVSFSCHHLFDLLSLHFSVPVTRKGSWLLRSQSLIWLAESTRIILPNSRSTTLIPSAKSLLPGEVSYSKGLLGHGNLGKHYYFAYCTWDVFVFHIHHFSYLHFIRKNQVVEKLGKLLCYHEMIVSCEYSCPQTYKYVYLCFSPNCVSFFFCFRHSCYTPLVYLSFLKMH